MTPPRREDEGQATVELALALPVVVALVLLVVQVVTLGRDQLLVTHAARVAAREAAVGAHAMPVHRAAVRSAPGLKASRMTTESSHQGGSPGMVIVEVRYDAPTEVPLVGPLLPDVALRAKVAMRDESGHGAAQPPQWAEKLAGLASRCEELCVSRAVTGIPWPD